MGSAKQATEVWGRHTVGVLCRFEWTLLLPKDTDQNKNEMQYYYKRPEPPLYQRKKKK